MTISMPSSTHPYSLHQPMALVEDVLPNIFWRLAQSKRTLRAAGLVCQAWYNPAMDVLWADISLINIISVLSPLEETEYRHRFVQPLTAHGWSRFHSLAHRVRDATLINNFFDSTLVSELYRTNPKPGPLLPNARLLWLRAERILHFLIWMGPTVESLNLFLETKGQSNWGEMHDAKTISDFFTQMGASCPNLTDLTLAGQGIGADSIAIAAQTIGQLRLLRTVYLSSFNNEDVTAILLKMAELPALESLSLNRLIDFPSYWPQAIASPFPELKKLLVKWPSDPGTGAFLHNLTSTRSHLIELELGEDLNGYIIDLGEKMTLAGEHKELESIVMYSKQDTAPLSLETLQPILECRSLTTLKLELGGDVGMTDDDMGTMASSLTKLKYLTFLSNKKEPSSCLTLRALSIAVALCPYLENLSVEVDACNTGFPVNEVHVAPHKRLRELDFGRSQVSTEADNLAYFIAGLSDAKGFGIFYPRRTKLTSRWNAVNGALPAMQMKRAADRDSQVC